MKFTTVAYLERDIEIAAADGIDSMLVPGASTSGCVRATVVDALQHGFRAVAASEAVADRDRAARDQSLADIDGRYEDVVARARARLV